MGKYQLIRKLATGGMAEVFLAKSSGPLGFEKLLVVKRILPHLAEDPQFVEMFLGEAKLAARLNHANIVQIFDFGLEGDSYFIAMEYVDGVDLRTIKRRAFHQDTPIAFPVCARLVSLACEGLAYAHELADPMTGKPLRLIHRDISPDNIFASKTGGLKILDFGIAKVTNAGQRTESGVLKGKVPYMAPEYLLGEAIDARIDVYALGVVLFELVTGHRPYRSDNDVRLIHAVLNDSLPDVRNFRQGIPEQLIHILTRALAKDRDQRYASCREFHADLERFLYLYSEPVGAVQIARFVQELSDPAHSDAVNAGESVPTTPEPRLLLDAASMQSPRSATTQRAPAPAPSPPPPEPIGAATEQLTAPMPAPRRAPLESVGADTEPLTAPLPGPPRRTPPEQLAPRRSVPRLEAKPATVPRRHAPDSGAAVTRRKPTRPETAIPPARPQGWLRRNLVWWASPLVTALVIMAVAGLVPSGASSESPGAVVPPVKARPSTTKAETGPSPSPVIVSALVQPEAPPAWRATTDARATSMAIEEAALAEAPTPEATIGNEGMALVRVTSKLPGEVRINGIKAGPTPLEHPAAPGTVRLSIDGVHKGNRFSKEAELALAADERRDFEFEIQPVTFTIRGRPDDMQVIKLDGRELHGQLKVTSYEGYHRLQLYHPPTEKEYTAFCKVEPRDKYCKFDVKLTP